MKVYKAFKFIMKYNDFAVALLNLEILVLSYMGSPSEPPIANKTPSNAEGTETKLDLNLVEMAIYLYLNFLALK